MPLAVQITYVSGNTQTGLLCRGSVNIDSYCTLDHNFHGTSVDGGQVNVWWDTVAKIKDITETNFLVVFKNGKERKLDHRMRRLAMIDDIGVVNAVPIGNIRKVEFLQPPIKDSHSNAMFDLWEYSPFTGEKLPKN